MYGKVTSSMTTLLVDGDPKATRAKQDLVTKLWRTLYNITGWQGPYFVDSFNIKNIGSNVG